MMPPTPRELSQIGLRLTGTELWCWMPVASWTEPHYKVDSRETYEPEPLRRGSALPFTQVQQHLETSLTFHSDHILDFVSAEEGVDGPIDVLFHPDLLHPDKDGQVLDGPWILTQLRPITKADLKVYEPGKDEWLVVDLAGPVLSHRPTSVTGVPLG